ncbi:MAG TPA: hypothetical protein PLL10_10740, partial [Elusimicrobiales bacterium]|nr:hypothetical protein [Elusimicrobiales bacterium]
VLERRGETALGSARGCVAAVRSSLRDALDSCIEPELILEHLEGGEFRKKAEAERVEWFLRLQSDYLRELVKAPVIAHQELFKAASEQAGVSGYLRSFDEIVFYGFYDLTGLQHELLRVVAKTARGVSLYFPLLKHPAYEFAKRFYESNIAGLVSETVWLEENWDSCAIGTAASALFNPSARRGRASTAALAVATASGRADELWYAAKEILRLVEQEGYAWRDICVTARSFEPYLPQLRGFFAEQRIPVADRISLPLAAHPLARWIFALLTAGQDGFSARRLRELIASPYFNRPAEAELWTRLCDGLGSVAGIEKISAALRSFSSDSDLGKSALPMAEWAQRLHDSVLPLSKPGRWGEMCAFAEAILEAQLERVT